MPVPSAAIMAPTPKETAEAPTKQIRRATFKLEGVEPAAKPPGDYTPDFVEVANSLKTLPKDIEAFHLESEGLPLVGIGDYHPLIGASYLSFAHHYPLVLSPDVIWLTISQGLATHIKENHERLKGKFVSHEGKLTLKVKRDEFVKGSEENDWPGVFTEFSEKIKEHIGAPMHELLVQDFSTTSPTAKAAFEVTLLDAMQHYFTYEVYSCCGIPEFTVEGTPEDWKAMKQRVLGFEAVDEGLKPWIEPLAKVLDEFIAASEGSHNPDFWRSWFKYNSASGGDVITGHIVYLFPYIHRSSEVLRNNFSTSYAEMNGDTGPAMRVKSAKETPAVSTAPFTWEYDWEELKMKFAAGLFGVAYSKEYGMKPVLGWAVVNDVPLCEGRIVPTHRKFISRKPFTPYRE